ncbi:MAG: hypothetical protein QOI81_1209, partial [Actinomycetota bacterium]|nr:hypothetical protein [Actinomycetota bacterium]
MAADRDIRILREADVRLALD